MAGARKTRKPGEKHPIVVIGGGAAGMTAAQTAALHYGNVLLFDKNPEPGKKLQSLPADGVFVSEDLPPDIFAGAFGDKGKFILPALKAFGLKELSEHLATMNIKLTLNGSSHLIVPPQDTVDFQDRLRRSAEEGGAAIRKSSKVSDIIFSRNLATAVVVNAVEHPVSSVIIACGSVASPSRGATGDGYEFARKAGHTVIPILPALVGLETIEKYGNALAGAEFPDCGIQVWRNDELQFSDRGPIKFTSYGIEGELILTHSARIIGLLDRHGDRNRVEIHIDMIPDIKKKDLEIWIAQRIIDSPKITVGKLLEEYIPEQLRKVMGRIMRIHSDKPVANLSHLERKHLILWVKDFHLTISRPLPFNETKGVLGGVSTDEIDPETMRSKKIKNLYFAGEVIDLLGPWGGYNFHKSFCTGYLAGFSAARALSG
jgi:predicted Rossmann fold flavoprotein